MAITYYFEGVHVIDQSGQPCGSQMRCCNRCGAMLVNGMMLIDNIAEWSALPESERCTRAAACTKDGVK